MTLEWEEIKEDIEKAHRSVENVLCDKLSTCCTKMPQEA